MPLFRPNSSAAAASPFHLVPAVLIVQSPANLHHNNSTEEEDMIVAHGLVDIRAGYTFRNWVTLSAGVNNLTNKVFLTSSDQVSMGRYLYTKLEFRF
ncbi:MAG: hypothetical protein WC902_06295 [Bacteroidales bacterium]